MATDPAQIGAALVRPQSAPVVDARALLRSPAFVNSLALGLRRSRARIAGIAGDTPSMLSLVALPSNAA